MARRRRLTRGTKAWGLVVNGGLAVYCGFLVVSGLTTGTLGLTRGTILRRSISPVAFGFTIAMFAVLAILFAVGCILLARAPLDDEMSARREGHRRRKSKSASGSAPGGTRTPKGD